MRVVFKRWVFSCPTVPLIAALIALPLFIALGFWQLDRAAEKGSLIEAEQAAATQPAMNVEVSQLGGLPNYSRVRLSGTLDTERQFLLDNQVHQQRAGFAVMTPLQGQQGAVLVNRGWVPMHADRRLAHVIDVAVPAIVDAEFTVTRPSEGLLLGEVLNRAEPTWPKVIQAQALPELAEALGYPVAPVVLQPVTDAGWTYTRVWTAVPSDPTKHYGYAVQWFAFAATLLVIVAVLTIKPIGTPNE